MNLLCMHLRGSNHHRGFQYRYNPDLRHLALGHPDTMLHMPRMA